MKRILLVDDDFKNSMWLMRFIEAEGYEAVSYTHLTLPTIGG